jgi:hypothetical protein
MTDRRLYQYRNDTEIGQIETTLNKADFTVGRMNIKKEIDLNQGT